MTPWLDDGDVAVYHGDSLDVLRELEAASIDAVITDPPYGIRFMGEAWDGAHIEEQTAWRRALETPTFRPDTGKPFSQRIGTGAMAARRARNRAFQEWCEAWARECLRILKPGGHLAAFGGTRTSHRLASGIEDAGFEIRDTLAWLYGQGFPKSRDLDGDWDGWGTALKPGHEPITLARKPLDGTTIANVRAYGTGALNIDACRIDGVVPQTTQGASSRIYGGGKGLAPTGRQASTPHDAGRWPANVLLDEEAAEILDEQTGELAAGNHPANRSPGASVYHGWPTGTAGRRRPTAPDAASRFFYTSKASASERHAGVPAAAGNFHPTVKPLDLMCWLVRLLVPPGALILDPFAGSGTTGVAARREHVRAILVEREEKYLPIIAGRVSQQGLF